MSKILVTGASGGIGSAIVCKLRGEGMIVIATGRRSELLKGDINITATLPRDIDILVNEIDKLDGIIHCAGIAVPRPFVYSDIKEIMDVNFFAPSLITQRLIKKINKGGSVIFISSIAGTNCSYNGGAVYSASKAALNGLMMGLAIELAPNIRVNCVSPGMVDTGIADPGKQDKYPLKRFGTPGEIADLVVFLLNAKWVTGSNYVIDGGYSVK